MRINEKQKMLEMNPSYLVTFSYYGHDKENVDVVEVYADAKNNKNEAYLRFEELLKEKMLYTANIAKIESTTEWFGLK